MAWPSMDHCRVPLLALASSTIITGSAIGAHKFMDICRSTVTKPPSLKRRYPSAGAEKAGFYARNNNNNNNTMYVMSHSLSLFSWYGGIANYAVTDDVTKGT